MPKKQDNIVNSLAHTKWKQVLYKHRQNIVEKFL